MLIDIHCHLDQYDPDELPGILERARARGIGRMFVAGTTVDSSRRCVELAHEYEELYAGVGIHPMDLVREISDSDLETLFKLAGDERVILLGEVGLDRAEGAPDFAMQEGAFRSLLGLARRLELPVVFHDRGATPDIARVLEHEQAGEHGGAAHYFQGTLATAYRYIEMGFHISLGRPLLRLPDLQQVAQQLPLDRIVLETDSFPQPFKKNRAKWTEPKDVALVAGKLAELHGVTFEEIAKQTTENVCRMLGAKADLLSIA